MTGLKKYKEILIGIGFLIFSIFYIIVGLDIPIVGNQAIDAQAYPRLLGIILALLSLCLIFKGAKNLKNVGADENTEVDKGKVIRVLLTILCLAVYCALLRRVGFLIMSVLYVFCQILILTPKDMRNYKVTAIISIVFPIVVYAIFLYGFKLMLPQGILNFM